MAPAGSPAREPVRLAAVVLPSEHGGWGFVAEALCVTLLATPSAVALPLAVATLAGFVGYQPLRLWLDDRLRGRSVPRTRLAARLAVGAGTVAAAAVAVAMAASARPLSVLLAMGVSGLLVAAQLALAVRGRGRSLSAELLGASAPGGVAAASAAGQDAGALVALGLWALLLGRGLPAVLLVRIRLRRDRGQPASSRACHVAHAAVVVAAAALAASPGPAVAALVVFVALWLRAAVVLAWPRPVRPQVLGIAELVIGLVAAAVLGLTAASTGSP